MAPTQSPTRSLTSSPDSAESNLSPSLCLSHHSGSSTSTRSDPHAVSSEDARSYYAGLHSRPILLYRTGNDWVPPEAKQSLKQLRPVFNHPIAEVWNDNLGWKVVDILDIHQIRFTTIDVVRFQLVDFAILSPTTVWIGVAPNSTTATAAHNASLDILALFKEFELTDIDIDYRESLYIHLRGPQLLEPVLEDDPLAPVIGALTPALGVGISTRARPSSLGTMALYLSEGGGSTNILGLTCRHVLFGGEEANTDYVYHPSAPPRHVLILGEGGYLRLIEEINYQMRLRAATTSFLGKRIQSSLKKENRAQLTLSEKLEHEKSIQVQDQQNRDESIKGEGILEGFLSQVKRDWKDLDNQYFGQVQFSPSLNFSVGEHHFTEDWAIFGISRSKLGSSFQGNKLDLGTKMSPAQFDLNCYATGNLGWKFEYPLDGLLSLHGTISHQDMLHPDMQDAAKRPCLLVIKNGSATGTTMGRANGVFSITCEYAIEGGKEVARTSMAWSILNYNAGPDVFSAPGDSGAIVADIQGRIGGMITSGAGTAATGRLDMTYATPFYAILSWIKSKGFPDACADVL